MKKKFLLVILSLIIFILLLFYWIRPLIGNSLFMPTYSKINKFCVENYSTLYNIVSYMKNYENDTLRWDSNEKDVIYIGHRELIHVPENTELEKDIQFLYDNDMQHILKESNYIMFVLWSSMDSSCGIIYCGDSNIIAENTKLEEICDDWYYYVHNSDR